MKPVVKITMIPMPAPSPVRAARPIPRIIWVIVRIIVIWRGPVIVIIRLGVRNDNRGGRGRSAGLNDFSWLCRSRLIAARGRHLRLLLLLEGRHHIVLVEHRINHPFGHALLFQINDLRRIQPINGAGILNISNNGAVADFCLGQLQYLCVSRRQRNGRSARGRRCRFSWGAVWHFIFAEGVCLLAETVTGGKNHQCGGDQRCACAWKALYFHNITLFRMIQHHNLVLVAQPVKANQTTIYAIISFNASVRSTSPGERSAGGYANACGIAAGGPTRRE